eukprot:TRINITY_DN7243_c0_g1_i1.p2 TRINITY_DN7243_c0_g1~~TRINITY_DN7243_c0_g1_i1.p2  ORF type:complete len:351 (-),score=100.48 TRINITY_DN7243_c0_g1_i1:278-1330(-)
MQYGASCCGKVFVSHLGTGILTDVFPPAALPKAFGTFGMAIEVGPIVGPILGGVVAESFSWRADFVLVAAMGLVTTLLIVAFVPETQHYKVLSAAPRPAAESAAESADVQMTLDKPKFLPPWKLLVYLRVPMFAWACWVMGLSMSLLYLGAVFVPLVAEHYYGFSQMQAGLLFIPIGTCGVLGSQGGGRFAAWLQQKYVILETQIVAFSIGSALAALAFIAMGWTLKLHVAVLVTFASLVEGFTSWTFAAVMSFATQFQPNNAGAVSSVVQFVQFSMSAVCILLGPLLVELIGFGVVCTALGGLLLLSLPPAVVFFVRGSRRFAAAAGGNSFQQLQLDAHDLQQQLVVHD